MTRLDGPDVSHYNYHPNADPDWVACRAAGCWWGATKMTQSTSSVDPTGPKSRAGMHAAGFTHIGLYHWLSSTTDPHAQADWFLQHVGALAQGEFVMLDAEEAGITAGTVLAWCERVEARVQRPSAVYSGAYVAGGTIWQSTRVRTSRYGARPMALAAYTTEARARALPGVAAYPWSSWQFSSNGPVPGVVGRCDMNRVDDRDAFDRAAGVDQPAPPVEVEPPTPPTPTPSLTALLEEDTVQTIADSDTLGSALVTFTTTPANDGSYRMAGVSADVRAMAVEAGMKVVKWPDAVYTARAGASYRG